MRRVHPRTEQKAELVRSHFPVRSRLHHPRRTRRAGDGRAARLARRAAARDRDRSLDSDIHVRGNEITITGAPADNAIAVRLFEELLELIQLRPEPHPGRGRPRARHAHRRHRPSGRPRCSSLNILSRRGKNIRPKTLNQKRYVDAIDKHTIVFGIGPAGTGKTYLAVAKAVQALQAKQVNRIILTRPAVEAGERLGFLPGTLYDKIDPYLRPLWTRCTTCSIRSRSRG